MQKLSTLCRRISAALSLGALLATALPHGDLHADSSSQATVEARVASLDAPVIVGQTVEFRGEGKGGAALSYRWDFGDGTRAEAAQTRHTFEKPGIHKVAFTVTDGSSSDTRLILVRAQSQDAPTLPRILLDTDAKNELDDQHYIAYALFSELDVLGINSIHHGGGQEATNHAEILHVLDLATQSGLPGNRQPLVFRGANKPMDVPQSSVWSDTAPIVTEASEAILAAARGASPAQPVWVLPVGPCTNVASAVLQARRDGFDLKDRIRIVWLGGGPESVHVRSFNGRNDPWSVYVVGRSGVPFDIILENPTGASLHLNKTVEADLYPQNPLGQYLLRIMPPRDKALYDLTAVSLVIAEALNRQWLLKVEQVTIAGPQKEYRWEKTDAATSVRVIRDIDEKAMKDDFVNTLHGKPTRFGAARP